MADVLEILGLSGQLQVHGVQRLILVVVAAIAGSKGGSGRNAGGSGNGIAIFVDLHTQRQAHLSKDFLDFIQALAAEVLGLQHFGFGLLHELADGLNVGVLEAVVAADRKLKLFNATIQVVVAQQGAAFFTARLGFDFLFEVDEDVHVVLEKLGSQAYSVSGQHGSVSPHFNGQLVVVGDLTKARGFHQVVDAAHRRVDRVDGNETQAKVCIEVLVG